MLHLRKTLVLVALGVSTVGGAATFSSAWDPAQFADPAYFERVNSTIQSAQNTANGGSVTVQFGSRPSQFGQRTSTPWNWSGNDSISFILTNHENYRVKIGFVVQTTSNPNDYTNAVVTVFYLEPLQTKKFITVLNGQHGSAFNVRVLPPVVNEAYGRLYGARRDLNLQNVYHWRFSTGDARITIDGMRLVSSTPASFTNIADGFGQYTGATWTGKATSVADLQAQAAEEQVDLQANPSYAEMSGTTLLPHQGSSARWRTTTIDGKRYLVHPSGNAFWSLGVGGVNNWGLTPVQGRESMFAELPDPNGPFGDVYRTVGTPWGTRNAIMFTRYNMARKYGADTWFSQWLGITRQRMNSWGLNTYSTAANPALYQEGSVPFTTQLWTRDFPTRVNTPLGPVPDPYSADFVDWMKTSFASDLNTASMQTNFIGAFVDNEIPWGIMADPNHRINVGRSVVAMSAQQPAKRALLSYLRGRYVTVARLNRAWGTRLRTWNDVTRPMILNSTQTSRASADLVRFQAHFARQYYASVRTALDELGFDGLYLGSRFGDSTTNEAWLAAEPFVDVVSVNTYFDIDEFDWSRVDQSTKPVLFSEYAVTQFGEGRFGGMGDASTPQERVFRSDRFIRRALRHPNVVGLHWFQFYDQPVTGREDGENYGLGLFSITDRPHTEMRTMFRQLAADMYQYRRDN
jgi:hypothetical protein